MSSETSEPDIEPRRGMPDPRLSREEFRRALPAPIRRPGVRSRCAGRLDALEAVAWDAYTPAARRRTRARPDAGSPIPTTICRSTGWRRAPRSRRRSAARRSGGARAHPDRQRLVAQRAHLPRRDVEELPAGRDRARGDRRARRHAARSSSSTCRGSRPSTGATSIRARPASRPRPPLCHWPCSCYPNHSLGQTQDWMNEIYPMWVAAHGIMIVTPVNWYQVVLAAQADDRPPGVRRRRQSRSDADPRQGRQARQSSSSSRAGTIRAISPAGCSRWWCMATSRAPRTSGARSPTGCRFMHLVPAGPSAELDRYIGYWKPYATSHDELDRRRGDPGRGAQRRAHAGRGGDGAARSGSMVEAGASCASRGRNEGGASFYRAAKRSGQGCKQTAISRPNSRR